MDIFYNNEIFNDIDKYSEWRSLTGEEVTRKNLLVTTIKSPLGIKDRLGNLVTGTVIIRIEATVT